MKIWFKNRSKNKKEIVKFRKFLRKISWTVDMNMQMSELMMSWAHFFHNIYIRFLKCYFFLKHVKSRPHNKNISHLHYFAFIQGDIRQVLLSQSWNMRFFVTSVDKLNGKTVRRWDHQRTYLCLRNVSWKTAKLYHLFYSLFLIRFSGLDLSFKNLQLLY